MPSGYIYANASLLFYLYSGNGPGIPRLSKFLNVPNSSMNIPFKVRAAIPIVKDNLMDELVGECLFQKQIVPLNHTGVFFTLKLEGGRVDYVHPIFIREHDKDVNFGRIKHLHGKL